MRGIEGTEREEYIKYSSPSSRTSFSSLHLLHWCCLCVVVVVAVLTVSSLSSESDSDSETSMVVSIGSSLVLFLFSSGGNRQKRSCSYSPDRQVATVPINAETHHHQTRSEATPLFQLIRASKLPLIPAEITLPTVLSETGRAVPTGRSTLLLLQGHTGLN